ncbi:MAG: MFS transporter [Chloroflexi bacterium]|nr:MFS transporter [Chloroflexota bacterium]
MDLRSTVSRLGAGSLFRSVARLGTFAAFRNVGFRYLWFASGLQTTAQAMEVLVLGFFVLKLTGSAINVALVVALMRIPTFLMSPVGGGLSDRLSSKTVLVIGALVIAASWLGLTVALVTGSLNLPVLLVLVLLLGIGWGLDQPPREALIYDLLGARGIVNAVSLDAVGRHFSGVGGSLLGGFLIELFGYEATFGTISAMYFLSLLLILPIRKIQPDEGRGHRPFLAEVVEGMRYVRQHRVILGVVLIALLLNGFSSPVGQLMPVFTREVLRIGPGFTGLLLAMQRLTNSLGSVFIASLPGVRRPGLWYFGGIFVSTALYLAFAWSTWFPLSLLIMAASGLGHAPFSSLQTPIVMRSSAPEMRGRSVGILLLARSMLVPPGILLMGAALGFLGPQWGLTVVVTANLCLMALAAASLPDMLKERWGGPAK